MSELVDEVLTSVNDIFKDFMDPAGTEHTCGLWDKRMVVKYPIMMDPTVLHRSTKPANAVGGAKMIIFWEGAQPAYAACIYLRWRVEEDGTGQFVIRLVAGKARLSKLLSTLRSELNGFLILCRLVTAVLDGLGELHVRNSMIGDSECTISSVEAENSATEWEKSWNT